MGLAQGTMRRVECDAADSECAGFGAVGVDDVFLEPKMKKFLTLALVCASFGVSAAAPNWYQTGRAAEGNKSVFLDLNNIKINKDHRGEETSRDFWAQMVFDTNQIISGKSFNTLKLKVNIVCGSDNHRILYRMYLLKEKIIESDSMYYSTDLVPGSLMEGAVERACQ